YFASTVPFACSFYELMYMLHFDTYPLSLHDALPILLLARLLPRKRQARMHRLASSAGHLRCLPRAPVTTSSARCCTACVPLIGCQSPRPSRRLKALWSTRH